MDDDRLFNDQKRLFFCLRFSSELMLLFASSTDLPALLYLYPHDNDIALLFFDAFVTHHRTVPMSVSVPAPWTTTTTTSTITQLLLRERSALPCASARSTF
eukprot:scaffold55_cov225-Ochromonas_danica.AAC.17